MPAQVPGRKQPELLPASSEGPGPLTVARKPTGAARDQALTSALERFGAFAPTHRPDDPDAWVTAIRTLPAAEARFAPWPSLIDPRLRAALEARGIPELYTHQAAAVELALSGRNFVVTTPTASGKTLCYNSPVLSTILSDPASRALYLFPTKALAQDQLAELHELVGHVNEAASTEIGVFTYDGDTPQDARRAIRSRAHIVLTNPDMLHSGILPHHPKWARLLENLRYIVIDELHAYRGVFGSHLANVLRRLSRICRHYGSDPLFICSSATIANPSELAERLAERPFEHVEDSGAPRGEKLFLFVNPPVVNRELGIRRSYLSEARRVAAEFLKRQLQVIVFCQSRLSTEILTTYLKDDFEGPPGTPEQVRGYRGGYLPLRRREIERGLRAGQVRAVVATNALELGIDIGALDTVVMAGYPGTIASTWQRAGRAGRRQGRSAAVMVASSAPVDQFVVRNPSYFFDQSPEHALVNPDNLHILLDHVKCGAFELPFGAGERFGREDVQEVLKLLSEEGFVHLVEDGDAGQWNWTHESYPADAVSLRSISSDNFVVVDVTRGADIIGETDFTSALATLHEKAIYLVEGRLFQVERLDFEGRKAFVRSVECDYYTDAITYSRVTILDVFQTEMAQADLKVCATEDFAPAGPEADLKVCATESAADVRPGDDSTPVAQGFSPAVSPAALRSHGDVRVVSRVVGFKKIKFYTNENVGSGELDLPEQQMHTTAYWLTLPRALMATLPYSLEDRRDGVAGLGFAMKQVAQLLLMCDRQDLGLSIGAGDEGPVPGELAARQDLDEPRIFLYDSYPGGIGFSEPLFGMHQALLTETRRLIAGCECSYGCPTCVGPAGESGLRAKQVALLILERLLHPVVAA
jgi:DEAD/DEAH box helicase domain-containing protein